MPKNTLAPGYIRLLYTVTINGIARPHIMNLGVRPADWSAATATIYKRDNAAIDWSAGVNVLVGWLKPCWPNVANFVSATLYRQDTPSSEPQYQSEYSIAQAGTGGGSVTAGRQETFTYRTFDGGIYKMVLLETGAGEVVRESVLTPATPRADLKDYVIGTTSWIYARDNSHPKTFLWRTAKMNDKLREKLLGM